MLVHFMDGGKWPEIARQAGQEPLASDDDDDDADEHHRGMITGDDPEKGAASVGSLAAIAAGALAHQGSTAQSIQSTEGERIMDAVRPNIPSIASTYAGDPRAPPSQDPSNKPEAVASPGGLPPIRQHSPKSHHPNGNATGPITLPSITAQLGDLTHLTEQTGSADSPYPQSPPTRPPHMYAAAPNHGSPPRSPNDTFRRGLLSPSNPNNYYYSQSNHQRIAQADGTQYTTAGEYSSSSTETPSTEHSAPTPSLPIDRMSIDGITNPQVGGFQCAYPGCTAQPFQTQVSSEFSCGIVDGRSKTDIKTVPPKLPRQRALVNPSSLLPGEGLPSQRRREGLQEEERDDPARPRARFPRLRVSVLSRQRAQVPTAGQSPEVRLLLFFTP